MKNILVVDDEEEIVKLISRLLTRKGFNVSSATNGQLALDIINKEEIDLLITDIIMPEKEGIEVIFELLKTKPDCKIIAMSGGGYVNPADYLVTAEEIGVHATFAKPFNNKELLDKVEEILAD